MHARDLIQLAASAASHSQLLSHSRTPFPKEAIEKYWVACRCQLEDWSRAFKEFSRSTEQTVNVADRDVSWILPVMEECLTVDVFSRVWAAVSSLVDTHNGTSESSGAVRGVWDSHRDVRDRVLSLLVYGRGLRIVDAVTINWYRIRCERWTDTLLSFLDPAAGDGGFGFQPGRVRRLAASLREQENASGPNLAKSLLLATLQAAYFRPLFPVTFSPDWNRQIADSVVACFPPHVFDATGQPMSPQQLWLWNSSSDNRGRLELAPRKQSATPNKPGEFDQESTLGTRVARRFDLN